MRSIATAFGLGFAVKSARRSTNTRFLNGQIVTLHAGPLQVDYENGSLRYIRLGDTEVLRRLYVAVRGTDWKTVPSCLLRESLTFHEDSFHIEVTVQHADEDVSFTWEGQLSGEADGTIRLSISGEPDKPFLRNRIGICVLHPIEGCVGRPCVIAHGDGLREQKYFPKLIAPHQPFFDVRSISHEIGAGVFAEVSVTGDVFETEDQRNWTDYSFKTYSTPLALPFPVLVGPGDRVEQCAELTLRPKSSFHASASSGPVTLRVDDSETHSVPELGSMLPDDNGDPPVPIDYVRIDVGFDQSGRPSTIRLAQRPGKPIEVAIFTDRPELEIPVAAARFSELAATVSRYLIFSRDGRTTPLQNLSIARRYLRDAPIGGGSDMNFAELNRNRDLAGEAEFLSWAVNPRVHATDWQTMIENIQGQGATVESARAFFEGPLRISPVLIPAVEDQSPWILGTINELGRSGIESVTFSHFHPLIAEIAQFRGGRLYFTCCSDPLKAGGLVIESGGRTHTWVANYLDRTQVVHIAGREVLVGPRQVQRLEDE